MLSVSGDQPGMTVVEDLGHGLWVAILLVDILLAGILQMPEALLAEGRLATALGAADLDHSHGAVLVALYHHHVENAHLGLEYRSGRHTCLLVVGTA